MVQGCYPENTESNGQENGKMKFNLALYRDYMGRIANSMVPDSLHTYREGYLKQIIKHQVGKHFIYNQAGNLGVGFRFRFRVKGLRFRVTILGNVSFGE